MKGLQIFLNSKGYDLEVDGVLGKNTLSAVREYISTVFLNKKYVHMNKGLVYLRTDDKLTNSYDDFVVLFVNGEIKMIAPCSTTAGNYYIQNPITYGGVTGTAIAVEQQVIGSHQFVYKKDWTTLWLKMPYFKQIKPIGIFRDGNKDGILNRAKIFMGLFGINLHRGGLGGMIDKWSAGCQVTPDVFWKEIIKYFSEGEIINFNLIN
jgi:peptidoglycan hydrolase-like protein with peptidoglycan-binding domain